MRTRPREVRVTEPSKKELLVYIDGKFVPESHATVSVFDHGLLYGDGIFEGIAVYGAKAFMLDHHLDRLFRSAETIGLQLPLSKNGFAHAVKQTVAMNELVSGYVRPIVTRGRGPLGLNPALCKRPTVVIIPQRVEDYPLMNIRRPGKAIVSRFRRNPPYSLPASAKTLNYINNILAKLEANAAGVDEAVMLDWQGNLSEGTGDNVFLVRGGDVLTPTIDNSILPGITRLVVFKLCARHGISCREVPLTKEDLYSAEEAFLTSTSLEIQPLVEVDGSRIGSGKEGPVTRRLRVYFEKLKKSGVV